MAWPGSTYAITTAGQFPNWALEIRAKEWSSAWDITPVLSCFDLHVPYVPVADPQTDSAYGSPIDGIGGEFGALVPLKLSAAGYVPGLF